MYVCLSTAHSHRKPSIRESCIIHKEQHQLKLAQTVSVNMMLPGNGPPPPLSDSVPILSVGEGHDFFQSIQRAEALSMAPPQERDQTQCKQPCGESCGAVLILPSTLTFTISCEDSVVIGSPVTMRIIDVNPLLRPHSVLAKSTMEKLLRRVERTRERGWGWASATWGCKIAESLQGDSICYEHLSRWDCWNGPYGPFFSEVPIRSLCKTEHKSVSIAVSRYGHLAQY